MQNSKKTLNNFGTKDGNIVMAVAVSGLLLAAGYFGLQYAQKSVVSQSASSNEVEAKLLNDMVLAKLGQTVASTAILCSEVKQTCYWNPRTRGAGEMFYPPAKFGVSEIEELEDRVAMNVEVCLPTSLEDSISFDNCTKATARATVQFVNNEDLEEANIVHRKLSDDEGRALQDLDRYAALVSVESKLIYNSGQEKPYVTTAMVRRPRPFLTIDGKSSMCKPTCALADTYDKNNQFCYGRVKITNNENAQDDTTKANVTVVVRNEGPGQLYRFQLRREFEPNTNFEAGNRAVESSVVFDSASQADLEHGLAPGESFEVTDTSIPCFDEKIHRTHVRRVVNGIPSDVTTVTASATNSKPSGKAKFSFVPQTLEPANALMLGQGGASVDATKTSSVRAIVIRIPGMN